MPRPIYAEIDLLALRRNLAVMREKAAGRAVWAVVKANAYGHGLENAVTAFAEADGLATIDLSDAMLARRCGWQKRLLLLEGFFDASDIEPLTSLKVETIIHSPWQIELLRQAQPEDVRCHIKVNSGMNRLGFLPVEVNTVYDQLTSIPGVRVMDVVTHFANAEPTYQADKPASVERQLSRMGRLAHGATAACMANSAATLFHPEVGGDAVRAGVALYGVSPDSHISSEELGIVPAMTLTAEIIAIQEIAAGEAVGYGSRWIAKRPSRIGVVACGYADGYPRSMPDGAPVWVEGQIAPLAGAVSMDMLEIDITDIPAAKLGSRVELWGRHLPVNRVAAACGTIGYELICALARRVPIRLREQG
ncbi:alanine racemase [Sutterella sp.]|uniref:alanine racemase n=1 Tax=Sutterella sp. TaxID=1981025 RepID=UPI0026DEAA83|nr:alanine racemase [Sutterella sp.]MDO5531570.1 alanine racemase [Sutterella sp.]